ncbi:hypothetical protein LWI29_012299 [Acer saccharum]|uniref:Uncharacterized protein n=1 Tax=Acer saccharum TaxID=4024 RepID=A0AA39RCG1_ACESA|nr:hypothetical protein LWI29_012299 [Acer saccharum]
MKSCGYRQTTAIQSVSLMRMDDGEASVSRQEVGVTDQGLGDSFNDNGDKDEDDGDDNDDDDLASPSSLCVTVFLGLR